MKKQGKFVRSCLALLFGVWLLTACKSELQVHDQNLPTKNFRSSQVKKVLRHAKGFSVAETESTIVVQVLKPWQGADKPLTYLMLKSGEKSSRRGHGDTITLNAPIHRMITLTATHLFPFQILGVLDSLVGLGGGGFIYNPKILEKLKSGKILSVGDDGHVDVETILSLKPDLVFTNIVSNSSEGVLAKFAATSIPVAVDADYLESTPLGRAEWIKFTAAFFDKSKKADSLFNSVDSAYQSLKTLAHTTTNKPRVFVNAPYAGIWWMPGGRSFMAQFISDAGGDYVWSEDSTQGSMNLDFETVLAKAGQADFWFNPNDWHSLAQAKNLDKRYAYFKAFKQGGVYNHDRIRNLKGGNDFFESGPIRPDLILADLIAILHPELLPQHKLYWYRKLEEKE